jgi:hypothetical protein
MINVIIYFAILGFIAKYQDRIQPKLWIVISIISIINGLFLAQYLTDITY